MELKEKMIEVRESYISLIKKELYGPGSEYSIPDEDHELITNRPEVRYSIGVLFPQKNKINSENNDSMRIEESTTVDEEDTDIISNEDEQIEELDQNNSKNEKSFDPEEENLDEEISLAAQNLPSSMGITFFVKGNIQKVLCDLSFATYRRADISDCMVPFYPKDPRTFYLPIQLSQYMKYVSGEINHLQLIAPVKKKDIRELFELGVIEDRNLLNAAYRLCDQYKSGYVRKPHQYKILLDFSQSDYTDHTKNVQNIEKLKGTNVKVTALRRLVKDDIYSLTIMIVNDLIDTPDGTNCILQPQISVSTENNNFRFCEFGNNIDFSKMNDEERSLALLYRNMKVFGSGLGTSIDWSINEEGFGEIQSDYFPIKEVPSMDFELPEEYPVSKDALSMRFLSDLNNLDKEDKINILRQIVASYETWINKLNITADGLSSSFQKQAFQHITNCINASNRMNIGLEILSNNEVAWEAFLLANRAMYMQREQLKMQEVLSNRERYPYDEELVAYLQKTNYHASEDKHFWRPFQIAFLLMSIESIVKDNAGVRDLVDLIWFPTGGGKTEAYLGLTAFTIFYRRLRYKENSAGTTVIMRYTLRLLAAQQFTRASTLICACESIRRDSNCKRPKYKKYDLGKDPITIGLWIGSDHTPNKSIDGEKSAKKYLSKLMEANHNNISFIKDNYNKFQVLKCPWCGTKLVKDKVDNKLVGEWGYRMRDNKYFELRCPQECCEFNNILPVQVVDEELYRQPPTLLFGTVDKFAMLPWENEIGSFFAKGNNNRAPDLIIQDELHLISGPLGTIVGLYETAIDALCKSKGASPKIVASTATIRNAKEQCSVLYNREVVQFPPPGLDAEDSFFARELKVSYKEGQYGRKYVGLMPSGKTKAMMEVRSIAALLQKAHSMDIPYDLKDKIWTLTVYFNSLKDLGKCRTLVDDDVKDFIIRMAMRVGTKNDARKIASADELTSRCSTTELNETLDKLEKTAYSLENIQIKKYPSNVLLATNMISVGIDVARLNIMLLVGQPKLTSEYIQASSRVGRSYPGVAFVMYDGSKSRDRSHFEQFKAYHESFYKFVEPTGATPYSKPARERGLHAIVTTLLRYSGIGLEEEKDAGMFDKDYFAKDVERISKYIINRVREINERAELGYEDESDLINEEIRRYIDRWDELAKQYGEENFYYGKRYMITPPSEPNGRLLKMYGSSPYDSSATDTLTSMRNVDSSVAGNVLIWEDLNDY